MNMSRYLLVKPKPKCSYVDRLLKMRCVAHKRRKRKFIYLLKYDIACMLFKISSIHNLVRKKRILFLSVSSYPGHNMNSFTFTACYLNILYN